MVIILQDRAVGDDWRVVEAASWDFGGSRATIWGGPTHYSENYLQEMGAENGERKRVKKWGQYSHYLGFGGGCQNCYFHLLVFRATILGAPNQPTERKWVKGSFQNQLREARTHLPRKWIPGR